MSECFFDTKRLRVHQFRVRPTDGDQDERLLFVAFSLDPNAWIKPLVTVLVRQHSSFDDGHPYVDWCETADDCRRKKYGTEVLRAIESKLGRLSMGGATDAGVRFIEHYREPATRMPQWLM